LATAFVLINAESGVESETLGQLLQMHNVSEAHLVYGVYDIFVKVEADSMEEVKETITREIRSLDHIEGTMTLLVAEPSQIQNVEVPVAAMS
jgi:DNA-binding Lrp family transcriptional regulator